MCNSRRKIQEDEYWNSKPLTVPIECHPKKKVKLLFNFISLTANFGSITEELCCPEKIRNGIPPSDQVDNE